MLKGTIPGTPTHAPERHTAEQDLELSTRQSRKPWRVYPDTQRGGYIVKYYASDGRRKLHRVPGDILVLERAEKYAARWYDEHVGRAPQPAARVRLNRLPDDITLEQFGKLWTSGALAELYPDHVKVKATASSDEGRLRLYVYPVIGLHRVADFEGQRGLVLIERVLERLPKEKFTSASRRQILQALHRLMNLARYPSKLITMNPLPPGFLPKVGKAKAKSSLYPSEEAQLLGCCEVPLLYRVLYGLVAREGFRVGEALALTWTSLDLERGVVHLDQNKTDDARAWALDSGVVEAMSRWKKVTGVVGRPNVPVLATFQGVTVDRYTAAENLRAHLKLAGVTRSQLFESNESRLAIRAHDLRATFVTVSLALGKTEAWITDRTGHRSSQMIYAYKRAARTYAELGLGGFKPMWEAIPELRSV